MRRIAVGSRVQSLRSGPCSFQRWPASPRLREQRVEHFADHTLVDLTTGATAVTFSYDPQGRRTGRNAQAYAWDATSRLLTVSGSGVETYRYDGFGRRVQATHADASWTRSQYGQAGQMLYQENSASGMNLDHVYVAGSLVAIRRVPRTGGVALVRYQHTDALGSPVAGTDEVGALVVRTTYEPYGAALNRAVDGVGYGGHVMDAATGLVYMQQRYYDPGIGRFLSTDPVAADANTGANFNRYWYAANNPYRFTDPDGRFAETLWDAANVVMGTVSAYNNFSEGNIGAGLVDVGGVIVDAAATVIPVVPGGAGAAIKAARGFDKAAQLAKNAAQGAKAEAKVAKELGEHVAGQRVTLEASTGQRSVADMVTKDKSVVEVKSGNAQLRPGQKAVQADIQAGREVIPRGQNAAKAGLRPNEPTPMKCYNVKRC